MAGSVGLAKKQLRALDRLSGVPGIERFYLAGGSALTIHFGHRRSEDLDFFSLSKNEDLARFWEGAARATQGTLIKATDAAVKVLVAGVEIDLVRYSYPPIARFRRGPAGIRIAGRSDLAAMKLAAISRRGLRRDFWDLYEILESGASLSKCLTAFVRRFGKSESDLYHVIVSLTYFADAERDRSLPAGMSLSKWTELKAYFETIAPRALRRLSAQP